MYTVGQDVKKMITDRLIEGKTRQQVADELNKERIVSPTSDGKWNDKIISVLAIRWGYRKVKRMSKFQRRSEASKKAWQNRKLQTLPTLDCSDDIGAIVKSNLPKELKLKFLAEYL